VPKFYLLNSAVLTGPGDYSYRLVTAAEALIWLREKDFISRIGYPATAEHIFRLSCIRPEINREATKMNPGDEALIVRLKYRLADPGQKVNHAPSIEDWEYGVLKMHRQEKEE